MRRDQGDNSPYIQSIIISLPVSMVNGETRNLRAYFKSQGSIRYYRYGDTALIEINTSEFDPMRSCSLLELIMQHFLMLKSYNIISPGLEISNLRIHEIKLRFDISIPQAIFCHTSGFRKINEKKYRSNDYRQYKRQNDSFSESKGIQQSFVTVEHHDNGSSVVFSFSGRYREHIPFYSLNTPFYSFITHLLSLGSIYLTQIVNPENFKIAKGYVPFLPKEFYHMLNNANWFNENFRRRNITANFIGGLYNEL
jgi:hypothetical protein